MQDNTQKIQKFENDYWGVSIKELINNSNLEFNEQINIATCGVNPEISKYYLKKKGNYNIKFVPANEADYVIMTNRVVTHTNKNNGLIELVNCFDKYKGKDTFKVLRNGLLLSVIRKIN